MLALIFRKKNLAVLALALVGLGSFASCATEKPPPRLVNDPNDHPESAIPWNKQEQWEMGQGIPSALGENR